jgi:ribonuclease P protein subunit RPR2
MTVCCSMAKSKAGELGSGIPQRHLHSRISYLDQAATYLASTEETSERAETVKRDPARQIQSTHIQKCSRGIWPQSRNLLSQLRAVSLKSQIRLSSDLKRSFCRRCNTPLIPGKTSEIGITNNSRHGRKPWADVLVVECGFCGAVRRYPTGQKLQKGANAVEAQLVAEAGGQSAGKGT